MGVKDNLQSGRGRTKYTTEQLYALERSFCISQYPDSATMEDLGNLCGVGVDKISTWFQNRRSKFKRQSKDTNISWMRKHIFNKNPTTLIKAAESHVLSPPFTAPDTNTRVPRSNLNYMPVLSSGNLPSTPFYPPVLPYDMFSDITRDINANTESLTEQNQTQTIVAGISSQQVTSTFQTSSPKTQLCSSPGLPPQISPLPNSVSPCHITPPLQHLPSSHSCVLNTSSDTSSSSQQTTPPLSCQQVPSAYDHHDFRSYYINYTFPLHYFQSSMNQCMYRR